MPDNEAPAVVRYHTAGRRQPMLIGKDASGRRLAGGPYTVYQVVAVAVVATAMWNTTAIWASQLTPLSALLVIAGAAIGAGYLTGRLDFSGRNPVWMVLALLGSIPALLGARPGRMAGRPLPASRPHQVRALAVAHRPPVDVGAAATATASVSEVDPLPAEPAAPTRIAPPPIHLVDASVHLLDVPVARLTPLEAFLAAAGKAS